VPSDSTSPDSALLERLEERAMFVRLETVRLAKIAGAGHYTSSFSAAELFASLYYGGGLRIDPARPDWVDRDRFVLSKGHAAIGLYPVLGDLGYFNPAELDNFTRLGSVFGDHPNMRHIPGIDFSSGSLGHGLSVSLGMALAGRVSGKNYRCWTMLGDGELHEGQIWEAAMATAHYKLGTMIAVVDRNQLSIDGFTENVMGVEPIEDKFQSFGWNTVRFDGHNFCEILRAFAELPAAESDKPTALIADTVKGRGVKRMEFNTAWHVGGLVGADYDEVLDEIRAGLQPQEDVR